jgi:hypothetical protein
LRPRTNIRKVPAPLTSVTKVLSQRNFEESFQNSTVFFMVRLNISKSVAESISSMYCDPKHFISISTLLRLIGSNVLQIVFSSDLNENEQILKDLKIQNADLQRILESKANIATYTNNIDPNELNLETNRFEYNSAVSIADFLNDIPYHDLEMNVSNINKNITDLRSIASKMDLDT